MFARVLAEAHGGGIVDGDDFGFSCADQELANSGVRPICADQRQPVAEVPSSKLAVTILPSEE